MTTRPIEMTSGNLKNAKPNNQVHVDASRVFNAIPKSGSQAPRSMWGVGFGASECGENPRLGVFYLSPLRLEGTCNESSFTVLLCPLSREERNMPAMISRPYSSAMLTPLESRPYAATHPPRPSVAPDLPRSADTLCVLEAQQERKCQFLPRGRP